MRKPMEPFISADSLARTSKLGSLSADGVTLPFFMILEAHTHTHTKVEGTQKFYYETPLLLF